MSEVWPARAGGLGRGSRTRGTGAGRPVWGPGSGGPGSARAGRRQARPAARRPGAQRRGASGVAACRERGSRARPGSPAARVARRLGQGSRVALPGRGTLGATFPASRRQGRPRPPEPNLRRLTPLPLDVSSQVVGRGVYPREIGRGKFRVGDPWGPRGAGGGTGLKTVCPRVGL